MLRMPVGISSFEEIRERNDYYIDKTGLIRDLVRSSTKVTLFIRPRRFGKTLTMRMLESFFNIEKDSNSLFEELEISKYKELCGEWMNQYPVISLTFKEIEDLDFKTAYAKLKNKITDLFRQYRFVLNSNKIKILDKEQFSKLESGEATSDKIQEALKLLINILYTPMPERWLSMIR